MTNYLIRSAESSDLPQITVLANYVWLDTYVQGGISAEIANYLLNQLNLTSIQAKLSQPGYSGKVLLHGETLIGYILLQLPSVCKSAPDYVCEIENLYIKRQFQGLGLGRMLLHAAVSTLNEKVWLTVNAGNQGAQQFYETLGFSNTGSEFFELGESRHENYVYLLTQAGKLLKK